MTVTWFTFATLAIAALIIGTSIWKGIEKGTRGSVLTLLTSVFCVILGITLSRLLSPLFSYSFTVYMRDTMSDGYYVGGSAGMETVIRCFAEMIFGAIAFSVVFFALRLPVGIIVKLVCKRLMPESGYDAVDAVAADNSKARKKERLYGGLLGTLCGIISTAVVISPIMGTVKTLNKATGIMDDGGEYVWSFIAVDATQVHSIDKYSSDLGGNLFYCLGGELVYSATAATTVNGRNASLPREIDDISASVTDLMAVLPIFEDLSPVSPEEKAKMDAFCDHLEDANTMKYIAVEFVGNCSLMWLSGGQHFGISSPDFGSVLGTVFADLLRVCQTTDVNYIAQDMRSLFNVYTVIVNSGFIGEGGEILLDDVSLADGFVKEIEAEISKNPRLAPVKNSLRNAAMRVFVEEIHLPGYGGEQYDNLMTNLATAINLVNSEDGASLETKRRMFATYADEYLGDFGTSVSDDMINITSEMIVDRFDGFEGEVAATDMDQFFKDILG